MRDMLNILNRKTKKSFDNFVLIKLSYSNIFAQLLI